MNREKHDKTIGDIWHEQAEKENPLVSFLVFALAVFAVIFTTVLMAEPAYADDSPDTGDLVAGELPEGPSDGNSDISGEKPKIDEKAVQLQKKLNKKFKLVKTKSKECKKKSKKVVKLVKKGQLEKAKDILKLAKKAYWKMRRGISALCELNVKSKQYKKAKRLWKPTEEYLFEAKKAYKDAVKAKKAERSHAAAATYLRRNGVVYSGGWRYTYYSQKVLPGYGLSIPGRHVGLAGMVVDGEGRVCVAATGLLRGSVINTPFGLAKVYDTGCPYGTIDVYTNW